MLRYFLFVHLTYGFFFIILPFDWYFSNKFILQSSLCLMCIVVMHLHIFNTYLKAHWPTIFDICTSCTAGYTIFNSCICRVADYQMMNFCHLCVTDDKRKESNVMLALRRCELYVPTLLIKSCEGAFVWTSIPVWQHFNN